jgi:hypothetical protein
VTLLRLTTAQVQRLERAAHAAGARASDLIRDAIDRLRIAAALPPMY